MQPDHNYPVQATDRQHKPTLLQAGTAQHVLLHFLCTGRLPWNTEPLELKQGLWKTETPVGPNSAEEELPQELGSSIKIILCLLFPGAENLKLLRLLEFQPLCCSGPLSRLKDPFWADNPNTPLQLTDRWSSLHGVLRISMECCIQVAILPPVCSTKTCS